MSVRFARTCQHLGVCLARLLLRRTGGRETARPDLHGRARRPADDRVGRQRPAGRGHGGQPGRGAHPAHRLGAHAGAHDAVRRTERQRRRGRHEARLGQVDGLAGRLEPRRQGRSEGAAQLQHRHPHLGRRHRRRAAARRCARQDLGRRHPRHRTCTDPWTCRPPAATCAPSRSRATRASAPPAATSTSRA